LEAHSRPAACGDPRRFRFDGRLLSIGVRLSAQALVGQPAQPHMTSERRPADAHGGGGRVGVAAGADQGDGLVDDGVGDGAGHAPGVACRPSGPGERRGRSWAENRIMLALLLLMAAVDPRLAGPLQLLAELHAAHPDIPDYGRAPDVLHLMLRVAPLPERAGGHYEPRTRTLTMAEALLGEDPRVMAAGLAHELTHASDFDLIAVGLLSADCAELEVRAFEAQAIVTRALWPDELPTGSAWETGLAMLVTADESGGVDGLRSMVAATTGYVGERC